MGLDQTTLNTQLTAIQSAITAALANPTANWRVGQVEFNQQDYLKYLMEMQEKLISLMRSEPSESIDTVQNGVDPLGHDYGEYLGEPVG